MSTRRPTATLALRADADGEVGWGHLMRCLALAQRWRDDGGEVLFISAGLDDAPRQRLKAEGFGVQVTGVEPGAEQDAVITVKAARESGAVLVVIDGYPFRGEFQRRVRSAGLGTLVIDDDGCSDYYDCDLLLNQNLSADRSLYEGRCGGATLLLGTSYALLRREFIASCEEPEPGSQNKSRLLVTMGGGDRRNVTRSVLEALDALQGERLEVRVAAGGSNPYLADLKFRAAASRHRVEVLTDVADFPALLCWADAAISAAGSTCWELAYCGVPMVLVVTADNQRGNARALEQGGAAQVIGEAPLVDAEPVSAAVAELMCDPERRSAMKRAGKKLVDGRGAERVAAELARLISKEREI